MPKFNFESRIESQTEQEPSRPASIRLELFRHDDKDKPAMPTPDAQVRLSPKGREGATAAGKSRSPEPAVAVAIGSSRERSVESALRQMLSWQEEITADMTLEEIREKVKENIPFGKKDMTTDLLNFNWDGSKEFNEAGMNRFKTSKDALVFLQDESDQLVVDLQDLESTSYSRAAGDIAELVSRYFTILGRWEQLVEEKPEKYKKFKNELQRFAGSHQCYVESFLMKIIEKQGGKEAVSIFFELLPDKNGFGVSQGYSIRIEERGEKPVGTITFQGVEWTFDETILNEIIQEKNDLNEKCKIAE